MARFKHVDRSFPIKLTPQAMTKSLSSERKEMFISALKPWLKDVMAPGCTSALL
jgi:hypothetical protein